MDIMHASQFETQVIIASNYWNRKDDFGHIFL